ncbi:MAG: hypothetical protein JW855_00625 [Gammaproteobacteria bacterium]|nr:hypothetical protein [Gammaproteobacteria bacterium]
MCIELNIRDIGFSIRLITEHIKNPKLNQKRTIQAVSLLVNNGIIRKGGIFKKPLNDQMVEQLFSGDPGSVVQKAENIIEDGKRWRVCSDARHGFFHPFVAGEIEIADSRKVIQPTNERAVRNRCS